MRAEKWCSGPCGRLLPVESFYVNTRGNPQGHCKACHRVYARESYRAQSNKGYSGILFRRAQSARKRAEYHASKVAA